MNIDPDHGILTWLPDTEGVYQIVEAFNSVETQEFSIEVGRIQPIVRNIPIENPIVTGYDAGSGGCFIKAIVPMRSFVLSILEFFESSGRTSDGPRFKFNFRSWKI